jgi:hypothetical protein
MLKYTIIACDMHTYRLAHNAESAKHPHLLLLLVPEPVLQGGQLAMAAHLQRCKG